jgi:hypothetical protein
VCLVVVKVRILTTFRQNRKTIKKKTQEITKCLYEYFNCYIKIVVACTICEMSNLKCVYMHFILSFKSCVKLEEGQYD